jgi:pyruvate dehydrogenase E1 component alpha subunit
MATQTPTRKKLKPGPDAARSLDLLYQMMLIRRFEEKCAEEYSRSRIRGFLHLYIGEEAVAVGITQALRPDDYILNTYREHGHALARGLDPGAVMAEMFGMVQGCSRGRGGSMHLFDASRNFFGGNAIVGGHLPVAVGMALASKKQNRDNITVCFFGEGAAAEGEFHEALNLAALWQVPVLFVCENNGYAMGTAISYTHAEQNLDKRAAAYGIESFAADGMDLSAMIEAADRAVKYVRGEGKPCFLLANTYRFRAHSMFDAELYRDKSEVAQWKKRDPIPQYQDLLRQQGVLDDAALRKLAQKVEDTVQQAVAFAEAGQPEPVEELTRFVYSENPGHEHSNG